LAGARGREVGAPVMNSPSIFRSWLAPLEVWLFTVPTLMFKVRDTSSSDRSNA
jgi:hypothetical protein